MSLLRAAVRVSPVGLRGFSPVATCGARFKSKLFTPTPCPAPLVPSSIAAQTVSPISIPQVPAEPLECYVDVAPSKGLIAVVFERDHNWAETVAVELLTRALIANKYTGSSIIVRSDSTVALRALNGGKCSAKEIEACGARLRYVMGVLPFKVVGWKVPGKENVADSISRGRKRAGYVEVKCPVVIPEVLSAYVAPE